MYTNPLPAARANGSSAKLESAGSVALSTGSSQPFLTSSQRAALDAALAAKMSTLTTGANKSGSGRADAGSALQAFPCSHASALQDQHLGRRTWLC